METLYDQTLVPRILFTIVAVMIGVGPIFADFNKTHATNPLWPPHARFHVVWQGLSQNGVSVAAILNYVWGASFYSTLASMKLYGGALKDVNGIKPFRFNIFGNIYFVDTNLFGGTVLMLVNTLGLVLLCQ